MKVLIVGANGRGHALAWKAARSPRVSHVFVAPGNGGTDWTASEGVAACRSIPISIQGDDFAELVQFAQAEGIDFTLVGPELPLVNGIVDQFEENGLKIFGPNRAAAQLEGSKAFSKKFMAEAGIPTAEFGAFRSREAALSYLEMVDHQVVVKASGLAAGKGVIICNNRTEAAEAVNAIMGDQLFGAAGDEIIIEERMTGNEISLLAVCDGNIAKPLLATRDHKRIGNNDTGPNTGGMGAYGPIPEIDQATINEIMERVIQPTIDGMAQRGTPYVGILFAGIMLTPNGIKTLEFNCRFGDPETQVVLPMLASDLIDIVEAALNGELDQIEIENHPGACATVVMASPGYPNSYPKGLPISGVEEAGQEAIVFQAGTKRDGDQLVTSGGRVFAVTGRGKDLQAALDAAYAGVDKISFQGVQYRTDIGESSLRHIQPI